MGKALQISNDLLHPVNAVESFFHQIRQIIKNNIQIIQGDRVAFYGVEEVLQLVFGHALAHRQPLAADVVVLPAEAGDSSPAASRLLGPLQFDDAPEFADWLQTRRDAAARSAERPAAGDRR